MASGGSSGFPRAIPPRNPRCWRGAWRRCGRRVCLGTSRGVSLPFAAALAALALVVWAAGRLGGRKAALVAGGAFAFNLMTLRIATLAHEALRQSARLGSPAWLERTSEETLPCYLETTRMASLADILAELDAGRPLVAVVTQHSLQKARERGARLVSQARASGKRGALFSLVISSEDCQDAISRRPGDPRRRQAPP